MSRSNPAPVVSGKMQNSRKKRSENLSTSEVADIRSARPTRGRAKKRATSSANSCAEISIACHNFCSGFPVLRASVMLNRNEMSPASKCFLSR